MKWFIFKKFKHVLVTKFTLLHICSRSSWVFLLTITIGLNLEHFCSRHNTHVQMHNSVQVPERRFLIKEYYNRIWNHNANKVQIEWMNCVFIVCFIFASLNVPWALWLIEQKQTNYDGGLCCCFKCSCMAEWSAWFGMRWWCARGNFVIGDVLRPLWSHPFMTSAS